MASKRLGLRIRGLRGRRRREAIAQVLSDFESSGQSATAFCESAGLSAVTLTRWQREQRVHVSREPGPELVEIRAAPPRPGPFELTLPSGAVLRVPRGFDPGELERLLCALRSAC